MIRYLPIFILLFTPIFSNGQKRVGKVLDAFNNLPIPFAIVNINNETELTNVQGSFLFIKGDTIRVAHPFFHTKKFIADDSVKVSLERKKIVDLDSLKNKEVIKLQNGLILQNPTLKTDFQFFTKFNIDMFYHRSDIPPDSSGWKRLYKISQVFKEKFVHNSWYRSVTFNEIINVKNEIEEIDLKVPVFMAKYNATLEYLNIVEERFYNPMYKGAQKRYNYYKKDTTIFNGLQMRYVFADPKSNKKFKAVKATFVIRMNDQKTIGFTYQTVNHSYGDIKVYIANETFHDGTMMPTQIGIEGYFPRYPRKRLGLKFSLSQEIYDVEVIERDTSSRKLSLAILGEADSVNAQMDSIMLQPLDRQFDKNLHYLEKDTTDEKLSLQQVSKFGLDFSEGRIALKAGPVYLTNVFGLNKFEGVRLGIGIRTREEISDKVIFNGYGAFGFKDGKFKYGAGLGYKIGRKQKSVVGVLVKDDLLEPGRPRYLGKQRDIFRNFFASRMDRIISKSFLIQSKPTFYTSFEGGVELYSLQPQYDYRYVPDINDTVGTTDKFYFSEIKFRMLLGGRKNRQPGLSQLFLRQWGKFPNLHLNFSRGLKLDQGGDYDYNKFSTKLTQLVKWEKVGVFDITLEGGIMTENTPYQVMFTAPGSESALGSIIIKEAFQTMELYKFISDRFIHTFINYYLRESSNNLKRFNPRLGFSWSMGWGKVEGDINIHREIVVQDYPDGYFEAGILIDDLLNINVYNYFVARLGVGLFMGMGSYTTDFPAAARLTYSITPR